MKNEALYKPFLRIVLYYIISVFISMPFVLILNKNLLVDNLAMLMIDLIMCFIMTIIFKDKLQNTIKDFKKNWKKNLKTIFKYWFIGLFFMMLTNLIINIFILKGIAPNEEANRAVIDKYPLYASLTISIITPITEELLFRLNFKDTFKKRKTFCLVTGLLFGLMHVITSLSNPLYLLYLIPYSILGITFGLIFYDTKNILSSMIAHSIHNTISLIIIFLGI